MPGGGLLQLVAYGEQDMYLFGNPEITYYKVVYPKFQKLNCERNYNNFKISFNDKITTEEMCCREGSIPISSIDLNNLNQNEIFVNSKKVIKENERFLNEIRKNKESVKRKKMVNNFVAKSSLNYRVIDSNTRAQKMAQKTQIKNQMRKRH